MPRINPTKHLRSIRRSTLKIARSFKQLEARLRQAERLAAKNGPHQRRPVRLTPARRAQLKLQGQYMGTIRGLKPAQKARVKAVKARRGIEAAVRVARKLATS